MEKRYRSKITREKRLRFFPRLAPKVTGNNISSVKLVNIPLNLQYRAQNLSKLLSQIPTAYGLFFKIPEQMISVC